MAMSATDLQLVNSDVVTLRAVCNVFGLDSSLFNDPANKTFNNRKEAEKALFTNAIIPIAEKVGKSHTQFIAKNHFPDGRVRMRKDFERIEALQGDKKTEAEKDKIVVEGVNVVLNMPATIETKKAILKQTYDLPDEVLATITEPTNENNS